jgi:hypothetical protein
MIYWYRVESSQGVYNQQFINNVIRVCNVAAQYGLEVMIDFHTLIQESDAWSNPEYVGVGMNLIANSTTASSYVAMVSWTIRQLRGVPNIWSYAVLNEPWYWPLEQWRKTNWINLSVDLSRAVKAITDRPVTIRFVGALFERDWNWNSTLLGALDFISLNAYVQPEQPWEIYWRTFDQYKTGLTNLAQKALSLGKPVAITEFGANTSSDSEQMEWYQKYLAIFRSTPGLMGWFTYGWDSGYDPNNPNFTQIGDYTICDRLTGTPRPAYYVLESGKT